REGGAPPPWWRPPRTRTPAAQGPATRRPRRNEPRDRKGTTRRAPPAPPSKAAYRGSTATLLPSVASPYPSAPGEFRGSARERDVGRRARCGRVSARRRDDTSPARGWAARDVRAPRRSLGE